MTLRAVEILSNYPGVESLHPINSVSQRTGLSPYVIRAWESRYRAIVPVRSPGRHRLYSEKEIERLVLLKRAINDGQTIGKISALSNSDLQELVARAVRVEREAAVPLPLRERAIGATINFDARMLESAFREALLTFGHQGFLQRFVSPLAVEIGERWNLGTLTAGHEHFFTSAVKGFLIDHIRQAPISTQAPRIVMTTPRGQIHELGAVMAAALASNLGWHVIYLGPDLPAQEIASATKKCGAAAIGLSIVYPSDDPSLPIELQRLADFIDAHVRIVVGGSAARGYFATLSRLKMDYCENLGTLAKHLKSLRSLPDVN